jgi:hypothetical protein
LSFLFDIINANSISVNVRATDVRFIATLVGDSRTLLKVVSNQKHYWQDQITMILDA